MCAGSQWRSGSQSVNAVDTQNLEGLGLRYQPVRLHLHYWKAHSVSPRRRWRILQRLDRIKNLVRERYVDVGEKHSIAMTEQMQTET
jgi:hypothetical protein